jgi:predicted DNA-binding WGR domain protein
MNNLLTLTLEAHHGERNHHRCYQVMIGRDLLSDWVVVIRYGRIGYCGQEDRFAGGTATELQAVVQERLRRRLSAPKRIGCSYRLTEWSLASDFDANAWIPKEVLNRFRGESASELLSG